MAADKPPSRKHAASVPVPFGPSEALTAIQVLLPRLENWHVDGDASPQEFCAWIAINQLKARTFGDLIRGLRPSAQTSSPYRDVFKLVSDQVWHGEPPEKAGTEATAAADFAITLIQQPESLTDRGKTLELLKDFSDRLEPRRDEGDWRHLGAMFDRLLKLPAYDGIAPPGNLPPGVSSNDWQVVGRNIQSLDSRLLNDLGGAAVVLVQTAAKTPLPPVGETPKESEYVFRRNGNVYEIKWPGESGMVAVKGATGLANLCRLIQSPVAPVSMFELENGPGARRLDTQSIQPAAGEMTTQEIQVKVKRLKEEIEEANDPKEKSDLIGELKDYEESVKGLFGKNGRSGKRKARDLNNPNDKLRSNIGGRIETACKAIRDAGLPKLAEHLQLACSAVGAFYHYTPGIPGIEWDTSQKQ